MEKKVYELAIDPELRDLIPSLSEEEHRLLEDSILRSGCDTPLIVWNGTIVDGHNRYEICQKHGIPFTYEERAFESKDAAMFWMLEHQLARRNLNSYQRSLLAVRFEPMLKCEAEKRILSGKATDPPQNSAEGSSKGETREKLAKMAGVSRDTIAKVKELEAHADSETKKKLVDGTVSINRAYTDLKNKEHEGETRVCECCGLEKPYSDYRIPSNRNGYRPICKECEAKAKRAAKEAEEAAIQQSSEAVTDAPLSEPTAPASLTDVPVSVSGVTVKDGKLAHVMTGLPDDPAAFDQVVQMLQSAQNYYVAAFKGIIEQYKPAMITKEHNELLQGMLDNTADTIDDLFTDHIKEDK